MIEKQLETEWALLEPTADQRRRIERQVSEWLDAREMSLASEWLSLIRISPVRGIGYALASALSLLPFMPLGLLEVLFR